MYFCIELKNQIMLLGDILNTLASKAGISSTDAELMKVLSSPTISNAEVPDSIGSKFDTTLMNVEAAKNNPLVIAAIKAQVYNGVDSEVNRAIGEIGIEDALKAELDAEKNTNKKVALALKKIAELERAKADAKKGDKAELEKEIAKLNDSIKSINKEHTEKISKLTTDYENNLLTYDLKNTLKGYKYAFPAEMPEDIKIETVLSVLNKNLTEKDGKFIRENGALKLIKGSTNSDFYNEKNEKVDTKSFIDSVLANNKLLSVKADAQQAAASTVITNPEAGTKQDNSSMENAIKQSIADLTGA